jgi:hypothetical protein
MKFWTGTTWREISDLEARYRAQRGELDNQPPYPGDQDALTLSPLEQVPAPAAATPEPADQPIVGSQETASAPVSDESAAGADAAADAALDAALAEALAEAAPAATDVSAPAPLTKIEFANSKNLVSATLEASGVVAVEFTNGRTYRYANFTAELMRDWQAAKSAGSWFHQNVRSKPDRFPIIGTDGG